MNEEADSVGRHEARETGRLGVSTLRLTYSIRDMIWFGIVISLLMVVWLEKRERIRATQEAKNRAVENEYYAKKMLELEKLYYGTVDNPGPGTRAADVSP